MRWALSELDIELATQSQRKEMERRERVYRSGSSPLIVKGMTTIFGRRKSLKTESVPSHLAMPPIYSGGISERCEKTDHLVRGDPTEIVDNPIGAISRQRASFVPINSQYEGETAAAARLDSSDRILRHSGLARVGVRRQLSKTPQENIRFGFSTQVKPVACNSVNDRIKQATDSSLV